MPIQFEHGFFLVFFFIKFKIKKKISHLKGFKFFQILEKRLEVYLLKPMAESFIFLLFWKFLLNLNMKSDR